MGKDVVPKNWPSSFPYLSQPSFSPHLSKTQREALRVRPPDLTTVIPSNFPRGPCQSVRIAPINDPLHPANGQAGLFAARHLEPGTLILPYYGVVHSSLQPHCAAHEQSDYDLWLNKEAGVAVDADKAGNEARFVNDYRGVGQRPNAEFRECWDARYGHQCMAVFVLPTARTGQGKTATNGIAKGTEILVSYGKGFWAKRKEEQEKHAESASYDNVLQQYPSPLAECPEGSSFYANTHVGHGQHANNGHHEHASSLPAHEHESGHKPRRESIPASPQPAIIPMTQAEELRIAAQLSQDLSQGITSMLESSHHHAHHHTAVESTLQVTIVQHESDKQDLEFGTPQEHEPQQQQTQHHDEEQDAKYEQQEQRQRRQDQEPVEQLAEALRNGDNGNGPSINPTAEPSNPSHQHTESQFLPSGQQSGEYLHASQQQQQQQQQHDPQQHHQQSRQQHGNYIQGQQAPQGVSSQQPQPLQIDQSSQSPSQSQPLQHPQPLTLQTQSFQQHSHHPPLQPHGPLDHLAQQYVPSPHQNSQDNIPPRKRSKVSRACDECRRKKVKCDAPSETGEEPCSNCRRSSVNCLFSRIPQKRGPSKGYIKELADRIHHIEGKLASEGSLEVPTELLGGGRREFSDIFASSGQQEESRKRPYSSMSGGDYGSPHTARPTHWPLEPRPIQPYHAPSSEPKGSPYSANGLAPQPLAKSDTDAPSRRATSLEDVSVGVNGSVPPKMLINDSFGVYLNIVHQSFPFLAGSKGRVEAQLARCPPLLQDAFIEAFYGTMQSCVSAPGLYTNGDIGSATRIVAEWESDHTSPRNPLVDLVHLQTLVLMALGTDNYGPPSLKGEHGGPSKASILGRAVGLAYSMRLHMASSGVGAGTELDVDSDENIAVRTWWTLVMLDRWNAISTASPLFIPNDSVVLLPGLMPVLGENVYHLTRLSNIIGHFAPVALKPPQALVPEAGAVPILNSFFNLSIELFREVLPSNITPSTHPILNLAYWHSRLLSYLFQTNTKSGDAIWACRETVGLLLTNTALLSPLNHHFFGLTALALLELVKVEKTRTEAAPLLKDLLERNLAPSTWDGVIRGRITDVIRYLTAQSTADQSLQHLADLATASGAGPAKDERDSGPETLRTSATYSDLGFDPRPILHAGYLNVLAKSPLDNRPRSRSHDPPS
ncbi:hypothetical protein F5Y17DRAFT_457154 [Xylariaceae sp. FL0594]|nr:hypothetical protein F5Y17DRAFT_457154 [Xylariaceae sp. FL0594]